MKMTYDSSYYKSYWTSEGFVSYGDNEALKAFFAVVAQRIVDNYHPKLVLDAGCAMGHLVAALRDLGVEAYGIDISEYAISQVRQDLKPYCAVGSLTDNLPEMLPSRYDLVVSFEVLEHLSMEDGDKAIANLCRITDNILFSSTPGDFEDPTHVNVQQQEYWVKLYRKNGFARDLVVDATWCGAHSMLFRKNADNTLEDAVFEYEHKVRLMQGEIKALQDQYGVTNQIVMVQIDSGKGYVEKDRIYSCHTPDKPYVNIGITVPAGGKTIRIEPVKGYACLVSEVVVQPCEPDTSVKLLRHNGYQVGSSFLFETTEPELIYELSGKTPVVCQIIATVTLFPSMSVARQVKTLLTTLNEELQKAAKQQELNLRELCIDTEKKNVQLQAQLEQERAESAARNVQLQAQLEQERAESAEKNAQLQEQLEKARMESAEKNAQLCAQMVRKRSEVEKQKERLQAQVAKERAEAEKKNAQLQVQLEQVRTEAEKKLSQIQKNIAEAEKHAKTMQEQYAELEKQFTRTEKETVYYKKQEQKLIAELAHNEEERLGLLKKAHALKTMENQLARIELERNTYAARMVTMEQQMRVTMEQLNQTRAALECIQNSNSWRITGPLRKFLDWCKGYHRAAPPAEIPAQIEQQPPILEEPVFAPIQIPELVVAPTAPVLPPMNTTTDPADMLPESLFHNREGIKNLADHFSQYDVVSFDIFDTLIFRIFDKPTDVFRLLGHRLGEESFAKLRIQAEQKARERHAAENYEVNIHEIYEVLAEYLSVDPAEILKQELQAEKDCCYANPYLKRVFDELIRQKQKVILVSDMYWPKEYLQELLTKCGYTGYADIYVSCDYRFGKGSGKLQKYAEIDHPEADSFIHIGDNRISDIECTQKMGWDTWFYQSCHELGNSLRPAGLDRLSVSAYRSIVNTHLHADESVYSPAYEHGFRYAGFLVCGFCEWLNKYVEQNNIDKIFFLARDADILYKVYNKYYRKVDNEYVVTSRLAMWEMAFEANSEEFIQLFFLNRANMGSQTLATALEETDLEFLIPMLQKAGLSHESLLTHENYERFRAFLMEHYSDIIAHFAPSKRAGQQYFKKNVGSAKNICAVDIGWSGQILITMRKLFKEMYGDDVSLRGAYMAVTGNEATSGYVESDIITPYLFHGCMNQEIAIKTATLEGDMHAKFMEATFTSDQCTLLKYEPSGKNDVKMLYGMRTTDAEQVREIQRGIMAFVDQWQAQTQTVRPYLQIMPADAKTILDYAITNFRYCYAIFGDNQEWSMPLPNYKGQGTITTLGAMLQNRGFI